MREYIAKRFPMNLQLFAEDPNPNPDPTPNPDPDPNKGKTFTQAEVDAMMGQRLPRSEKDGQTKLAKELGYESVEAMRTALKNDKGNPDPVDIDKMVDQRMEERQKEQNQKTFNRLLNAEVKVLANELGFADWEDARALADLTAVKENDKGELEGVKEALETLAKSKPHLLKTKQGVGRFGADIGGGAPGDKKKRQEEMINLAKSRGTIGGQAVNDPWAKN